MSKNERLFQTLTSCLEKDKEFKYEIKDLEKIYIKMGDEISKKIFCDRLLFNYTQNYQYMIDMIRTDDDLKDYVHPSLGFWIRCKELKDAGREIALYGIGSFICGTEETYRDERFFNYRIMEAIEWDYFCDKNKAGQFFLQKEIISQDELLEKHKDAIIVIGAPDYYEEIKQELLCRGVEEGNIIQYPSHPIDDEIFFLDKKQYFERGLIFPDENEVFIDAGCFNGDTVMEFVNWSGKRYNKIIAFEPDKSNYEDCRNTLNREGFLNIRLENAGLYNYTGKISFASKGNGGSHITSEEADSISVISLDDYMHGERATFIKMDIEGAEKGAIIGAGNTIKKYGPKLALSVYHKRDDLLELPLSIMEFNNRYTFYLRHYSNFGIETVLYAIDEE